MTSGVKMFTDIAKFGMLKRCDLLGDTAYTSIFSPKEKKK